LFHFFYFDCNSAIDNGKDAALLRADLLNIARTTLSSKILRQHKVTNLVTEYDFDVEILCKHRLLLFCLWGSFFQDHFATLAVDAVLRLNGSTDLSRISIIKKTGGALQGQQRTVSTTQFVLIGLCTVFVLLCLCFFILEILLFVCFALFFNIKIFPWCVWLIVLFNVLFSLVCFIVHSLVALCFFNYFSFVCRELSGSGLFAGEARRRRTTQKSAELQSTTCLVFGVVVVWCC
jgi:hypothetical protein